MAGLPIRKPQATEASERIDGQADVTESGVFMRERPFIAVLLEVLLASLPVPVVLGCVACGGRGSTSGASTDAQAGDDAADAPSGTCSTPPLDAAATPPDASCLPEDVYFTAVLRTLGARMPDIQTAARFAVESLYTEHPVGVHGTDKCFHSLEVVGKIVRAIPY